MKHFKDFLKNKTENEKTKVLGKQELPKEDGGNRTRVFRKQDARPVKRRNPMETSATLYKESAPHVNEKAGKLRFLPAAVFAAGVLGLSIWFLFTPKTDYSSSEKRYLQQFPETSFSTVTSGKFGEDFETFFADQFPARNMWVGVNSYCTLALGNNGANGVYNGRDGYLINVPVSKDNNFLKNIDAIKDFKQNLGDTPLSVMLAPSTGYICADRSAMMREIKNMNDDGLISSKGQNILLL